MAASSLEAELETTLTELLAAGAPGALGLAVGPWGRVGRAVGLDATGRPLQTTTPFDTGSITKTFLAAIMLALVEDGALRLDDDCELHLPSHLARIGAVSVRSLLNHTSGVPDFFEEPGFATAWREDPSGEWTRDELMHISLGLPRHQLGTFSYSNTNYILAELVIESASGASFEDLLSRRILEPLGLSSTSLSETGPSGVTRLVSTADDLARFLAALISGEIISESSLHEMLATVPSDWEESQGYGLGIEAVESLMGFEASPCGVAWGHVGLGQVTATAFTTPDAARQVVLMANGLVTADAAWAALNRATWAVLCSSPK
jgi:D-alanyl-D-alanine carboxypeptidase